jgi:hypothetical protein
VVDNNGYGAAWNANNPNGIGDTTTNYFNNQINRGSYTLGNLADKAAAGVPGYSSYAAPTPVSAGAVQAGTGASFMGNYTQPWQQVTDSALNAYDVGADKAIGAFKGANAPFAANSRTELGRAALVNEIGAGRGALAGNLLGQGFTTAANLGQTDASRVAGVDTGNADRSLNAGQFNNSLTNQRQQFDVGSAYQGDAGRDAAATSMLNSQATAAGAKNSWLNGGQALLGQTGTNTGSTSGTSNINSSLESIANQFGISLGATSDVGSGTSNSTSSGKSNSKGGGASLG